VLGAEELPDSLGVAAEIAPGDGAAGARDKLVGTVEADDTFMGAVKGRGGVRGSQRRELLWRSRSMGE
jgi:hypothetical protein